MGQFEAIEEYEKDFLKNLLNGELVFKGFYRALEFLERPTHYEIRNNIKVESTKIIEGCETLKIVVRTTSDKRKTLILFFRNSTVYDIWKFWIPNEEQFEYMQKKVLPYIKAINDYNEKKSKK